MKAQKKITIALILFTLTSSISAQQIDTVFAYNTIRYPEYLKKVAENNLRYIAQKYNVDIAEAAILVSKEFPDPEFSINGVDNGQRMGLGYTYGAELAWLLELGGKRKARINVAQSEAETTQLLLEDFFRNLRADATLAYVDAIYKKNIFDVNYDSYQVMKKLATSDSVRFALGTLMKIDVRQSKLEAGMILNDVYQSLADWKGALTTLTLQIERDKIGVPYYPSGSFAFFDRKFELPQLIDLALENRADLQAALKNKKLSKDMLQLAKANRILDLGLSVGVTGNSVQYNVVAPTPSSTAVGGGIIIPLKFSNNLKGELKQAQFGVEQAEILYKQASLQIQTEVTQAYYQYIAVKEQVKQFDKGLLEEAKKVFEGKIYSYKLGATSLLEVLNAKRTYNDVNQSYHTAYRDLGAALVELERVAGIWDIEI